MTATGMHKNKFLQINTHRSQAVMDMALATAKNMGAQIILISEPNKAALKKHNEWICDENLDTCIIIMDNQINIKSRGNGTGFSFIETENYSDFNTKSLLWGEKRKDRRGEVMAEWISQNNLTLLNDDVSPTFCVGNYTSIIDLT